MSTLKKKKLHLNPDEMAFRAIYSDLLMEEKISVVFRPGKRVCGDFRGYCPGQKVEAKVIKKVGSDEAGIPPEFYDNLIKKIIIETVEAKRIGDLNKEDFRGSSPDSVNKELLRYKLGTIYNLLSSQLTDDSFVTVIKFNYEEIK